MTEVTTTRASFLHWINQTLRDPTLSVAVCPASGRGRRVVPRVQIARHWKGAKTQVTYQTSYGRGWQYTQYNSGSPSAFGEYADQVTGVGLLHSPPCYAVYPSGIVWADRGKADVSDRHRAAKVCLNKH